MAVSIICWLCPFLFAAMLLLGGAGNEFPLLTAAVQTLAVLLALIAICFPRDGRHPVRPLPRTALALTAAIIFFIVLQLAPLPPSLWQAENGRALAGGILAAAHLPPEWHSLSLDPVRTWLAALELLPGLAMLLLGCRAGHQLRFRLIAVFLGVALLSGVLGLLQRLDPSSSLLAPYGHLSGDSPGIFVNRNHQATMLLLAIPAAAYLFRSNAAKVAGLSAVAVGWATIAFLAAAILATTSRAGFGLLPLAIIGSGLILHQRKPSLRVALVALLPIGLAFALVSQSPTVQRVLDRFSQERDERTLYWGHANDLARQYLPFGSGLGSFTLVYPAAEQRQDLSDAYVNDAHNDYIELWLEGGLPAVAVFLTLIAILATGLRRQIRGDASESRSKLAVLVLSCWLILLAHSVVDYPLRMLSLMAFAGLSLGLLLAQPKPAASFAPASPEKKMRTWLSRGAASAMLACLLLPIWATALSQRALKAKDPSLALHYNPWSSEALADLSAADLDERHDDASALRHARAALAISPFEVKAAAVLVAALDAQGRTAEADALAVQAGRLGWREPRLQYRLARLAAEREDYGRAVLHADALLRTGNFVELVTPFMRAVATMEEGIAPLVTVLADNPVWRRPFLTSLSDLTEEGAALHGRLLAELRASKAPPTKGEVNAYVNWLLKQNSFERAREFAASYGVSAAPANLLEEAAIAPLFKTDEADDPFAWRSDSPSGVSITSDHPATIAVRSDHATAGIVLRRLLLLAPGAVVLEGQVTEENPGSMRYLSWSLTCRGANQPLVANASAPPSQSAGKRSFALRFDVPAEGCAAQDLTLYLSTDTPSGVAVTVQQLRLVPGSAKPRA